MAGVVPPGEGSRLRPAEVKQVFEVAQTSQGLLDAYFRICSDYFRACVLVFFDGDHAVIRRTHGRPASAVAIGARFSRDESAALGPLRGGGELGAAAVNVDASDALVRSGAWFPSDALLLPLVVGGRTVAAVVGERGFSEAHRADLLTITTMASTALSSIVVRRTTSAAAVSEATRIMSAPLRADDLATAKTRKLALWVQAGTGIVVVAAALFFLFGGRRSPTSLSLAEIPGQPKVDALALVPAARGASGLGDRSELVSIRATVAPDGKTNLLEPGLGADPWPARIVFASRDTVAEMEIDRGGMYPPSPRERGTGTDTCGACGCDIPAPKPHCLIPQVLDAARGAGLGASEAAVVTYSFCKTEGPRWVVSVPDRGEVRVSDASCKALEHESLHAAPRKLATIPGAPRVDPMALLEDARAQSGIPHATLVKVEAWYVGSDGIVDVGSAGRRARIEYTFAEGPSNGGTRVRRVVLDADGLSVRSNDKLDGVRAAPKPACSISTLWRSTLAAAPTGELAHVIYEVDPAQSSRGSWTIELAASAVHHVRSDVACVAWN
jgi:hypothetical protein